VAADVSTIVVKNPETALVEFRVIVAIDAVRDAGDAILSALESLAARERSNPSFSGRILFVVRGTEPETPFPPELEAVQSQIDARLTEAGMRTAAGHPFDVKIEYRESPF
jgi:hypothetical protein